MNHTLTPFNYSILPVILKKGFFLTSAVVLAIGLSACHKSEDEQPQQNDTPVASDASAASAAIPASPASGDNMSSSLPNRDISIMSKGNATIIHIVNVQAAREYSVSFSRQSRDANGQVQQQVEESGNANSQNLSTQTIVKSAQNTDNASSPNENTASDNVSATSAQTINPASSTSKLVVDGKEIQTTGDIQSVKEKAGAIDVIILNDPHPQIKDLATGKEIDSTSVTTSGS
jgi:hypothetical protein